MLERFDHLELGAAGIESRVVGNRRTLSAQADGIYGLVVNGGAPLTVAYAMRGSTNQASVIRC